MHTPGPWTAANSGLIDCIFAKDSIGADRRICELIGPDIDSNARLIEQAPNLLKCLQDLIECLGEDGYFPQAGKTKTDAARDAIAKAIG